jgi:uncharacterized protein YndB with AHSA1/START domain
MNTITVSVKIKAPLEKVWEFWTSPEHITHWNFASDDWECPSAEGTLEVGARFRSRMSAKDGSEGFDFGGIYTEVVPHQTLAYVMDDGRTVRVDFSEQDGLATVTEVFDPETENTIELQQAGWQAILNNFKQYAEGR